MKKMMFLLLVSSLSFASGDFKARCLSAGGYYGNISAKSTEDGKIRLIAAQGFSYNLTRQLGLTPSSAIHLAFEDSDCKKATTASGSKLIRCRADGINAALENSGPGETIQVANISFEIREALIETVDGKKESFLVSLFMRVLNNKGVPVQGETTFTFNEPLGNCSFK